MGEALTALRDYDGVVEAAMLSTCGRIEIYAELVDYESGTEQLKRFLSNFRHAGVAYDIDSYLYTLLGRQAIDHLLRVATGLDSMLIGEAQILGQVKDAYVQAQRARSIGASLHQLFRGALTAGKEARSRTAIGRHSVSIATAAVEMAKSHVGDLNGKHVVVVGAGKMGRAAAHRLKLEGARLVILNRSHERASELIDEIGRGHSGALSQLSGALRDADVLITSTGASHFVLDYAKATEVMSSRSDRPLFIVDIAVPRDVDPEAAQIPGVALADIDSLSAVVDESLESRRSAVPYVEEIIEEHVRRLVSWYESRSAVPVIASLMQKADAIRDAEVQRLFSRCPELSERARMLIVGMSMTIVSRLLHGAVVRIRESASSKADEALLHARIVDELFDLSANAAEEKFAVDGAPKQ